MRILISTLVLFLTAVVSSQLIAASAGDQVIGEWRGTSLCTNLEKAPACKDETVRFVFTRNDGAATYHLVGDKLVSGSYQTMGEMDLVYSAADATWSYEFKTPNCAGCRWWYRMNAKDLIGGLTDQSGEQVRKVLVRRHVP